jgi:hypothetical protein
VSPLTVSPFFVVGLTMPTAALGMLAMLPVMFGVGGYAMVSR